MKKITKLLLKTASTLGDVKKTDVNKQRKWTEIIHIDPLSYLHKTLDLRISLEDREIPIRLFIPEKPQNNKLLIFFHGGGWTTDNVKSYTSACYNLAKEAKAIVVSVEYRLAPENKFPSALEDCYEVCKKFFVENDILDVEGKEIVLIGDSAGGNLAAATSLLARDRGEFLITKQILIYPATHYDHSASSPFPSVHTEGELYFLTAKDVEAYMHYYQRSPEDQYNYYFSPLLCNDLKNQPKTLIITAEHDPLRDEGEAYGEKLKQFGNDVEIHRILGTVHGFFNFRLLQKPNKEAYTYIKDFLNGEDTNEKRENKVV